MLIIYWRIRRNVNDKDKESGIITTTLNTKNISKVQ